MFEELDKKPAVKDMLYKNYPVYAQTDEYVIFDLQHPLETQPKGKRSKMEIVRNPNYLPNPG